MRIESDVKLDFCDVLLKPKRSTIESRKDINLERTFKFRWSENTWTGIPIISSNMTSVTTHKVSAKMQARRMLSCLPKTEDALPGDNINYVIPSVGLNGLVCPTKWVALDVPNGYIESVLDFTRKLREGYGPSVTLIAGNVVSSEQTEALILAGADIVKVGIGSGAACSTRIKTGVGMPQLSAVIECSDAAHGLGGHIISDGGCQTPADIVKAFAGGSDFVMLGSILAGHDENAGTCQRCRGTGNDPVGQLLNEGPECVSCGGSGKVHDFYGSSSERGNNELSGGLKDYRASEGFQIKLPARGPLNRTLQDIEGGLRSACSYVGARNIKALPRCATFVMVNRQANTSLLEYRI